MSDSLYVVLGLLALLLVAAVGWTLLGAFILFVASYFGLAGDWGWVQAFFAGFLLTVLLGFITR